MDCAKSVQEGLEIAKKHKRDLSKWRSVITHMEGRFGDLGCLKGEGEKANIFLTEGDIRLAELAIFKKAYKILKLKSFPSKLLSCSLKLGPILNGKIKLWHLEQKVGANIVVTCPPKFLTQLLQEEIDVALEERIEDIIPDDVFKRLIRIDYFKRAYYEDGYSRDEYTQLTAFKKTEHEHLTATNQMISFIKKCINS